MRRAMLGMGGVALAVLAAPGIAGAAATYCSPSGDRCAEVRQRGGTVEAVEVLAARYTPTRRMCLLTPDRGLLCSTVPVRPAGGVFEAIVRRPAYSGVYRLRVAGTPPLVLRARGRSVERRARTCRAVPGASRLVAINLGCASARGLVARTAASGRRVAPAGWTFLAQARGCGGVIVPRKHANWSRISNLLTRPGTPGVRAVITRGCRAD